MGLNRFKTITLDKDTQDQYWRSVLANAYFLRFPASPPGTGSFVSMRELYRILKKLQLSGADLVRVEELLRPGKLGLRQPGETLRPKISRLKLEQGQVPDAKWAQIRAEDLPRYKDQLRWLFTISVLGAAMEYVDLAAELPAEWVGDVLGKYGGRIAELRAEIITEMIEKDRRLYFELEDGKVYCLAPGKTGRRMAGGRPVVELTPEEAVIVAEAQEAGLLLAGAKGAQGALKWAG